MLMEWSGWGVGRTAWMTEASRFWSMPYCSHGSQRETVVLGELSDGGSCARTRFVRRDSTASRARGGREKNIVENAKPGLF